MEDKVINLIRVLSLSNEIYINIELEMGHFHTIEIDDEHLVLHNFDGRGFDNSFSFDVFSEDDKKKIYDNLKVLIYN